MALSDTDLAFVADNPSAAMITVGEDGMAKAVRVAVAVVDGRLWSSGTEGRARTARVRRDPRCTLFVFDSGYAALTLEATVAVLDGPDVPELSLKMFRQLQGKPEGPLGWFGGELDEEAFLQAMRDEGRVIYEFEVTKSYGIT
jgi:hypothetical protein